MILWSKTFYCFCHWRLNHLIIFCLYAGHTMNHLCYIGISVYSIFFSSFFYFATVIFLMGDTILWYHIHYTQHTGKHTCTHHYTYIILFKFLSLFFSSYYCRGCCCCCCFALRSFPICRRFRLFNAAHSFLMAQPCKVSASFYFERLRKIVNRVTSVTQPIKNHPPLNNFCVSLIWRIISVS